MRDVSSRRFGLMASAAALMGVTVAGGQASGKSREPPFHIDVTPAQGVAKQGTTFVAHVTISRTSNKLVPLTFRAAQLPSGARAKPVSVEPGATTADVAISVPSAVLPGGPFPVQIRASGGGAQHTATLALRVLPADASSTWLQRVNAHRAIARLPEAVEEPEWSAGCFFHTRYMIENHVGGHDEQRGNPLFTEAGLACAKSADLGLDLDINARDESGIDGLVAGPFHGVQILDPGLSRTGFASYRARTKGPQMASAIDVLRGRGDVPPSVRFPVLYPGDGATAVISGLSTGEWPASAPSCAGLGAAPGAPILFIAGGAKAPSVTQSRLVVGGADVSHCRFDENTYTNPAAYDQDHGRNILAARHTIVLIPTAPLRKGQKATVSLSVDGKTTTWSFTMGAD